MTSSSLLALVVALLLAGAVVRARAERSAAADDLAPGMPAPDFTLQASNGRTYRLSEFKGRQAVVVAWFPKAFTAG